MDFKQLEYFKIIYEEGSISKAAEKLYISQQGLSKAILSLEKELDCRHFERNSKGVSLTEPGKTLLSYVDRVLRERDLITRDMQRFREHDKLSLAMVIGARFSLPKEFFKGLQEKYPEMELSIQEQNNEFCMYHLEHGKTDLAIVIGSEPPKGYIRKPIKKEKITLVMPKNHELTDKKELSLNDLNGQKIAYHMGTSSAVVLDKCRQNGVSFSKAIEVPGMVALYQICSAMGILGISLGSLEGKMAFEDLVAGPLREEEATWDVALMYHESMKKVKPVMNFVDYLKDRLEETGEVTVW